MTTTRRFLLASLLLAAACGPPPAPEGPTPAPSAPAPAPVAPAAGPMNALDRQAFNLQAARLHYPLFWRNDDDGDGVLDIAELEVLWGIDGSTRGDWVQDGKPSARLQEAYAAMTSPAAPSPADATEANRRKLIDRELAGGQPTLVGNDFSAATAEDKAILENLLAAADVIEEIHQKQIGSWSLREQLPDHRPSRAVFHRNQGPWCVAPETEKDPACNAIPSLPKKISGLYPAALQAKEGFCEALKSEPNGEQLRHQFTVVRGELGKLEAVPYHVAYAAEMKRVSELLKKAAAAVTSPGEAALKKYLLAAAQAFLDDKWEPADEAWAAMNAKNSKWYLRIAPDEVYFEPCSLKAGFHVSFARINQDSLKWQARLDPVKTKMEQALAKLAGAPYKAREVSFDLPDFIDIVINAGDSRSSHGATIGQSLPNWGPVANEGRGRTVAMTNLYTDADSRKTLEGQASSLFCSATMAKFTSDPTPQIMGTVLHEAAHNLGPSHEYKANGKTAREIFGGPLASTLEELKAQTAALYFTDWLVENKVLTKDEAEKAHVRDIAWTFGHISRGMYSGDGKPKPYSQLAAIQIGWLLANGAAEYKPNDKANNGQDQGCFELHLDKFPKVVEALMRDVAGVKARGDKKRAEALKKRFVDDEGELADLRKIIQERWLRAPKATFVYSVRQ
ncbi:MAG: hypothetical protein R3B72_40400 [Polyangiaceae bacterium]